MVGKNLNILVVKVNGKNLNIFKILYYYFGWKIS